MNIIYKTICKKCKNSFSGKSKYEMEMKLHSHKCEQPIEKIHRIINLTNERVDHDK